MAVLFLTTLQSFLQNSFCKFLTIKALFSAQNASVYITPILLEIIPVYYKRCISYCHKNKTDTSTCQSKFCIAYGMSIVYVCYWQHEHVGPLTIWTLLCTIYAMNLISKLHFIAIMLQGYCIYCILIMILELEYFIRILQCKVTVLLKSVHITLSIGWLMY